MAKGGSMVIFHVANGYTVTLPGKYMYRQTPDTWMGHRPQKGTQKGDSPQHLWQGEACEAMKGSGHHLPGNPLGRLFV